MKLRKFFLVLLFLVFSNLLLAMREECQLAAAGVAETSAAGDDYLRLFWTSLYRDMGCV